ncbi:MAG: hypothetical protein WDO13_06195 [Verrucomicrobiota bacterium]
MFPNLDFQLATLEQELVQDQLDHLAKIDREAKQLEPGIADARAVIRRYLDLDLTQDQKSELGKALQTLALWILIEGEIPAIRKQLEDKLSSISNPKTP